MFINSYYWRMPKDERKRLKELNKKIDEERGKLIMREFAYSTLGIPRKPTKHKKKNQTKIRVTFCSVFPDKDSMDIAYDTIVTIPDTPKLEEPL